MESELSVEFEKVLDLNQKALDHISLQEYDLALPLLYEALTLFPASPDLQNTISEVYFNQNKYEECISACEKFFEIARKGIADFQLMNQATERIDECKSKLNISPNLPPGFSLAPPGSKGRFVTCNKNIKKGTELLSEFPISSIIEEEHFDQLCHICKRKSIDLILCDKCKYASYCQKCIKDNNSKQIQCSQFIEKDEFKGFECDSISTLRQIHPFTNGEISLGLCIVRLYNMIEKDQKKALELLRLQTHREDFDKLGSKGNHYTPALMAGYILYPPEVKDAGDSFIINGTTPPWIHENLVTLSAIHQINSYRFRRFPDSPPESEGGLFLQLAMFNHSCNPNCYLESVQGRMTLISERDINEGEEITTCYLPTITNIELRHEILKSLFFFSCDCLENNKK